MNKVEKILKHNKTLQSLYVFVFSIFFKFIGLFVRPKKNLILFQSLIGKNFGESPKILFDLIKSDPFFNGYTTIWAFQEPEKFVINCSKVIKLNSFKYFYYALKSGIWISNAGIERGLRFKHKKTIHINTDHGFAFKKIGNHQPNRRDYNFKTVDLFCCCSEFDRLNKISGYKINPENAVITGYPINDCLYKVDDSEIAELRKRFNVPIGKKVLLYAPTWRDQTAVKELDIDKWQNALCDNYVLFIRGHHLSREEKVSQSDFVRDGNKDISVEEICKISDILITDYSAIAFNYSILHRPIIGYTYDFDEYAKTRGTYLSLNDVFGDAHFDNENELIHYIKNIDFNLATKHTQKIQEKYMYCDGRASEYCINFLKEQITARWPEKTS